MFVSRGRWKDIAGGRRLLFQVPLYYCVLLFLAPAAWSISDACVCVESSGAQAMQSLSDLSQPGLSDHHPVAPQLHVTCSVSPPNSITCLHTGRLFPG